MGRAAVGFVLDPEMVPGTCVDFLPAGAGEGAGEGVAVAQACGVVTA